MRSRIRSSSASSKKSPRSCASQLHGSSSSRKTSTSCSAVGCCSTPSRTSLARSPPVCFRRCLTPPSARPRRLRSSVPRCSRSTSGERRPPRRNDCAQNSRRSVFRLAEVRYEQATRVYPGNDVPAVDGLDLEIGDGEFVVFVGPSGSGKTTALRMLAGLEEVDAGAIFIGDRDITDVAPKDRDVAMVFQNYALYPYLTVAANIAFPLKIAKMKAAERERRVRDVAEMLGLADLLERKPGQLSGGQRQRVAMGRAIVREPSVFLMDEPLSNLDAKLRVQMRADIAALQSRLGVTTVYVTHDQSEAMTLGHRVAVMDQGRLQQLGSPRELYDHPANTFVAGFIGSPAMNLCTLPVENGSVSLGGATISVPPGERERVVVG